VGIKPTTGETTPGDNLINIQQAAFAHPDPESAKKTENLTVFFLHFWDLHAQKLLDEIDP
jgi:hypothetical protein